MNRPFKGVLMVIGLYGLYLLGFVLTHSVDIYPGERRIGVPAPQIAIPGFEVWWLETDEGKVEGWWIPGSGVSPDSPGPAIVYFHNGEDLMDDVGLSVSSYRPMGISVLVIEYRGYGRSAGSPSQSKIVGDASEWYDRLIARPEVIDDSVVFQGRTLGAAVALHLAQSRLPKALILEAPFTSMRRLAYKNFVPEALVFDLWDNLNVALPSPVPAVVFHGEMDDVVPHYDGERIAKQLNATFRSYPSGHVDMPPDREAHHAHIVTLLRRAGVI